MNENGDFFVCSKKWKCEYKYKICMKHKILLFRQFLHKNKTEKSKLRMKYKIKIGFHKHPFYLFLKTGFLNVKNRIIVNCWCTLKIVAGVCAFFKQFFCLKYV